MFQVGQKVVCVDDSGWGAELYDLFSYPLRGKTYTVRQYFCALDGIAEVRLMELKNRRGIHSITGEVCEVSFRASRFRPLQERKTDISFAHEILRKNTKRQTVKA